MIELSQSGIYFDDLKYDDQAQTELSLEELVVDGEKVARTGWVDLCKNLLYKSDFMLGLYPTLKIQKPGYDFATYTSFWQFFILAFIAFYST